MKDAQNFDAVQLCSNTVRDNVVSTCNHQFPGVRDATGATYTWVAAEQGRRVMYALNQGLSRNGIIPSYILGCVFKISQRLVEPNYLHQHPSYSKPF